MSFNMENLKELNFQELEQINGGGVIGDVGDFVGKTWNTLYNSGRDFGRSVVNGLMK